MLIAEELTEQIHQLLSLAQIATSNVTISRCAKSGNNRLYRVETEHRVFAAKQYFAQPTDLRDRLGAEFSFLTFAEKITNKVPKPYAQIPERNIALYEFVEGEPLLPNEIGKAYVDQAIDFFCDLNCPKVRAQATSLKNASEACFSLYEHFNLISHRINQIQQIQAITDETQLAKTFANKLQAYWSNFTDQVEENTTVLTPDQRCISPSDFGFHNALKTKNNQLCFLDFEYAGWDDPCKMAADFFAQIALPVPEIFFEEFISKTMLLFTKSEDLIQRARTLRPAYQMKWCCIALNVFLPSHLERRKFANENINIDDLLRAQLGKVKQLLQPLEEKYGT